MSFDCSTEVCMWDGVSCKSSKICDGPGPVQKSQATCEKTNPACKWSCAPIVPPYAQFLEGTNRKLLGGGGGGNCTCSIGYGCTHYCSAAGVPPKAGTNMCPTMPTATITVGKLFGDTTYYKLVNVAGTAGCVEANVSASTAKIFGGEAGTCTSHGYTVPTGSRKIPFCCTVQGFKKPCGLARRAAAREQKRMGVNASTSTDAGIIISQSSPPTL